MINQTADLSRIERRLRQVLKLYTQAQTRGDFLEAVLGVHNALEDALGAHLGERASELSFNQKAKAKLPQLYERFGVETLNKQRNFYAHPKQPFADSEIRNTAVGFVNLALAAWTSLFGPYSSPPAVIHPSVSPAKFTPDPRPPSKPKITPPSLPSQEAQPAEKSTEKTKLPWLALIVGLLVLWPVPWLAGVTHQLWRERLISWYWPLFLSVLLLILALLSGRYLGRFLRALGLIRLVTTLSVSLLMATAALTPFMAQEEGWSGRAGAALTHLLSFVRSVTVTPVSSAYAQGVAQAEALFPTPATPTSPEVVSAPATASPVVQLTKPITTRVPTSTVISSEVITIGLKVVVRTDGNRLLSRVSPGRRAAVVTRFENGTQLLVLDGPVEADDFTWWEVEGKNGRGWSAADFLVPDNNVDSSRPKDEVLE